MVVNQVVYSYLQVYMKIQELRDALASANHKLVLAESCTAGMVAATLGQIPGISNFFCGSMVVYRTPTKNAWLGIDAGILADPAHGPVSALVTEMLAHAILKATPEASVAVAVTGHLGPDAPQDLDGTVFFAISYRDAPKRNRVLRSQVTQPAPRDSNDLQRRRERQMQATESLLEFIIESLLAR